ncbi:MAG: recombination protein RecR [Tenericutes bacterium]|nr:recombination mediator RecR [Bacilli bacterium]MDD3995391.1 recombination mediator RecR [Bacilli bacterium]MDD4624587.1 recombination mediator RecR [Bacilli bacterium]MDD4831469.1 recombination mediator RecR [Bacilli bacterium]NLV89928.1 recombination protein RecR [Mycoplasmatota bacterium]
MNYPDSLNNLIENFKKMPGIGEKTAERLAFSVLNFDQDDIDSFSKSIKEIKSKLKKCVVCNNLTESEKCNICDDLSRDNSIICVVEDTKNLYLFEKAGNYNGKYHVLDGLISPLNGINPEDINIDSLINRVHKENTKEVIIAVKPTIEGETTSLYILKLLKDTNVVVSKIAHGVPLGSDMEYLDALTLEMAMNDRKKISE